jgi:RNA polymerase-binding transcription factor DksA
MPKTLSKRRAMTDLIKELRLMNIDLTHRAADRISGLETENERIVAESKQCHGQNDRLASEHMQLRKRIRELEERLIATGTCPDCGAEIRCSYRKGKPYNHHCLSCGWELGDWWEQSDE